MSFINYTTKEINCKVVYYGADSSGKSTNLHHIYKKTNPDTKSKMVSLTSENDTTMFFDFLPLSLGEISGFKTRFHLYTVPGPHFFGSSRKLILKGVDGIVFVVDSQVERMEANLEALEDLKINLKELNYDLELTPLVVQYNKRDLSNVSQYEELQELLNPNQAFADFEAVANTGQGVFETFKSIAKLIITDLKKKNLK